MEGEVLWRLERFLRTVIPNLSTLFQQVKTPLSRAFLLYPQKSTVVTTTTFIYKKPAPKRTPQTYLLKTKRKIN